jgi:type III secretion protein T
MEPALALAALDPLLREAFAALPLLGLFASRPLGITLVLPVFTRLELGGVLRATLALALALPLLGAPTDGLAAATSATVPLALLVLKELLVGALIGFLLGIPFWSIQAVGELIDTQRGITNEVAPLDQATRSQASAMGLFLGLAAIAMFTAAGGLGVLSRALYESYAIWPTHSVLPKLSLDAAMAVVRTLDHLMSYTLLVAGPVVVLLLLVDLSVMLVGRSAPQLNAYDLAPLIKNLVFMVFMVLYLTYLADYMAAELASTRTLGAQLERLMR